MELRSRCLVLFGVLIYTHLSAELLIRDNSYREPQPQAIQQPLDHFDFNCDKTIPQRFWVNTNFWNQRCGPVFLYIGGESKVSHLNALYGGQVELARKMGAMVVVSEHRFYGKSKNPEGTTDSDLKFLTVKQSLQDLLLLQKHIIQTYRLSSNNPWVTFGVSYAGSLSAWLRQKFPSHIFAAVASSAPVKAQLTYDQYQMVGRAFSDFRIGGSSECANSVSQAFATVDNMIEKNEFQALKDTFEWCIYTDNQDDLASFVMNLATPFITAATYNNEGRDRTVAELCEVMTNRSLGNSYQRLAAIIKTHLPSRLPCMMNSANADRFIYSNHQSELRAWLYQKCSQLGFFQECNRTLDCPFSKLLTLDVNMQPCELFGLNKEQLQAGIDEINMEFGGKNPPASRIIFVNGDVDPWRVLSVTHEIAPLLPSIMIPASAHGVDLNPSTINDPQSLTSARKKTKRILEGWLKQLSCSRW
uniref:thymus-specific serine protease-like n=1 Tax=Myxine glutinosa TaxID=7769 RepID=UPI00358EA41E